jgi:hypothetical protein
LPRPVNGSQPGQLVETRIASSLADGVGAERLGQRLVDLGRADQAHGLAAISSLPYRKVHSVFQVDQHRRIDAGWCVSA